ncbi:hypothetical protein EDB83DRAFT_846508 [Lactarius deliciosus]|nr:hypothetical protein EDB83DRAFT_846508 [Lactarius deliciosus]
MLQRRCRLIALSVPFALLRTPNAFLSAMRQFFRRDWTDCVYMIAWLRFAASSHNAQPSMRVSLITVSLATRASRVAIIAESLLLRTGGMTILCRYKYIWSSQFASPNLSFISLAHSGVLRKTLFACTNKPCASADHRHTHKVQGLQVHFVRFLMTL